MDDGESTILYNEAFINVCINLHPRPEIGNRNDSGVGDYSIDPSSAEGPVQRGIAHIVTMHAEAGPA